MTKLPVTYWLVYSDHAVKLNDVRMQELPHDGRLSEELDLLLLPCLRLKHLHGYLGATVGALPQSLTHCAKLTRTEVLDNAIVLGI